MRFLIAAAAIALVAVPAHADTMANCGAAWKAKAPAAVAAGTFAAWSTMCRQKTYTVPKHTTANPQPGKAATSGAPASAKTTPKR